jgi:P27 family predicted phage terminase small subunit
MKTGPPPTPTALKLLRNNPGRRPIHPEREVQPPPIPLPDPPAALAGDRAAQVEARAEWTRRGAQLTALGLLTELDLPEFIAYCLAWGRYVDAEAQVAKNGEVVTVNGQIIPNPFRKVALVALKTCRIFWADFGMSPAARTRVQAPKGQARPLSKVERFMARVK